MPLLEMALIGPEVQSLCLSPHELPTFLKRLTSCRIESRRESVGNAYPSLDNQLVLDVRLKTIY
jgi:hypothetical protein